MKTDTTQRDLFRHSPQAIARAFRVAAESARTNPYETPEQAERRAAYYEAEAERMERSA